MGSYLYFNTATTKRLKEEEGLEHADAFKKASELWGAITDKERVKWDAMAAEDLKRFERETAELEKKGFFMTHDGIKSTDLPVDPKKKWGKDVMLPKPARSVYSYFTAENMAKIKEKEGCKHSEAMGFAGKEWATYSDKMKQPYEDEHLKDQKRHEKEMAHLIKHGWFTNEEGVKSTDIEKKIKKEKMKKDDDEKPAKEKVEKIKRKKD